MSCDLLSAGIGENCGNNIGGIKKMYITERANISFPLTLSSPGNEISGITMLGGAKFYEFVFTKGTSFYTESTASDESSGIELTTQTITLGLNKREKTKRDKIILTGKFKKLAIIITDSNDINWFHGEVNGCVRTLNDGGSGTQRVDPNRYTLTFVAEEPTPANTVTDAAIAAVI